MTRINPPANSAATLLDKAIVDLTALFESCDGEFADRIWEIIQTVCDARKSISENSSKKPGVDFADAVSGAMLNINKIRVVGSRYSDAVFGETDDDDEDCLILRTLIDFACEARRRLKIAETELFK